jgi:hypothetical protein
MDGETIVPPQRKRTAAERAQETAGAPPAPGSPGTLAPGYVHYGDLVYVPGQLLPPEVAEAFREQRPERDQHNVYRLETRPAKRRRSS